MSVIVLGGCLGTAPAVPDPGPPAPAPELPGLAASFTVAARGIAPPARVAALAWLPEGATTVVLAVHGCCGMNKDNNWPPMGAAPGYSLGSAVAATGRAFVGIDLPGSGTSQGGAAAGGLDDEALVVHQVARALRAGTFEVEGGEAPGFERVVGLGHSRGVVVVVLAQAYLGGFDAVIPTGYSAGPFSDEARRCFEQDRCPGDKKQGEILSPSMMFHQPHADPAVVAELMGGISAFGSPPVQPAAPLYPDAMERIRVPMLLVEGAEDWLFDRATLEAEPSRFPNAARADLLMLEDTGHMVFHHLSKDEAFAGLDAWLDGVGL